MDAAATLLDELLALAGVEEAAGDMMGERSLRVGGREFLHVHGTSLLHVHLTREQKAAALASGEARQHPYAPRSGMVELPLVSEHELPSARRLATLALEHASALLERRPRQPL